MESISVYINNLFENFQFHLNNNKRILFSGPFGIGKTYFLREFFNDKKIKDNYNVFHLFPVNYQVSQNEDIFELVKHDILYHILSYKWSFAPDEKDKISKSLALQAYTINKSSSALQSILKIFTLGKSDNILEGANQLEEIKDGFGKYYNDLNKQDDQLQTLREYAELFENKKGSIYEQDNITQLIQELLENHSIKIKDEDNKKENVLIIDDLDRIDPEHIFRILNIFSAHFDIDSEDSNKFGFDKVIFVCDIHNLRNIFFAKYGTKTDFNGYINKFFSSYIYYFDNRDEISKTIDAYIGVLFQDRRIKDGYKEVEGDLKNILYILIHSDCLTIRHLLNLESFDFTKSDFTNHLNISHRVSYLYLIKVLLFLFNNDEDKVMSVIDNVRLNHHYKFDMIFYLPQLIPLINIEKILRGIPMENVQGVFSDPNINYSVNYIMRSQHRCYYAELTGDLNFFGESSQLDLFKYVFKKAFTILKETKVIELLKK